MLRALEIDVADVDSYLREHEYMLGRHGFDVRGHVYVLGKLVFDVADVELMLRGHVFGPERQVLDVRDVERTLPGHEIDVAGVEFVSVCDDLH